MKQSRLFTLFLFGVVFLPWALPLNLLLKGTPLVIWKQLLAVVLSCAATNWIIQESRTDRFDALRMCWNFYLWVIFCILCWCIMSVAVEGLSLTRSLYAVVGYIGFFPYVFFPVIAQKNGKIRRVLRAVSSVSIACAIGLIGDYFLNLSGVAYMSLGADSDGAHGRYDFALIRASFPFEGPNTAYGFLSLGLLFTYLIYMEATTFRERFICLCGIAIIFLGGVLTATRSIWFLLVGWLTAMIIVEVVRGLQLKKIMLFMVFFLCCGVFFGKVFFSKLKQADILLERAQYAVSENAEANRHRYYRWRQGLELLTNFNAETFFGHGIGSTMGQVNDGFVAHTHYESSFFQSFYEGGVAGIFVRYFGYLVAIFWLCKGGTGNSRTNHLLLWWFVFYFISTFFSPTAAAYHGQMAFFIAVGMTMIGPYLHTDLKGTIIATR